MSRVAVALSLTLTVALALTLAFADGCHGCIDLAPCASPTDCDTGVCVRGFCAVRCTDASDCRGATVCNAGLCVDAIASLDDAGSPDAGSLDDAGSPVDAGAVDDAGSPVDAGAVDDAGASGEGEGEGEGCTPLFSDHFAGPAIDPAWQAFEDSGTTLVVDGALELTVPASGAGAGFVGLNGAVQDLRGTAIEVTLTTPVSVTGLQQFLGADIGCCTAVSIELDAPNSLQLFVTHLDGSPGPAQGVTFDPAQDVVWLLRFDGSNQATLATSPDGATFQDRVTVNDGEMEQILQNAQIRIGAGAGHATQGGSAAFDDLFLWPTTSCVP